MQVLWLKPMTSCYHRHTRSADSVTDVIRRVNSFIFPQIRGLVELERKREEEGLLTNSLTGSPLKRAFSSSDAAADGASTTSGDGESFSIDDVRSR